MLAAKRKVLFTGALILLLARAGGAQIVSWQLGGSGLAWGENDTVNVLIDFDSVEGAIQPVYITQDKNIISLLDNWSPFRQPKVLDYVDGEIARIWKWNEGRGDPTQNGSLLVDGDSTTYNAARAEPLNVQYFTFDLAVPVPVSRFGFFTPSKGYRADGTPLPTDFVPAFQISMQEETSEIFEQMGPVPLERIVADIRNNFEDQVAIDFPQQYVRFFRYARKLSLIDEEALSALWCGGGNCGGQGNQALSLQGSIGDFEIFGEGVPKRVIYKSKIIDMGQEQNFGRLFFAATPMRMVDGVAVEAPDARVAIKIEVRTGRDDDPAVYHEYTVTSKEKVVSRERYEIELRSPLARTCASCDFVARGPRPGIRASIGYDAENWTFWSTPFTESGQPLRLRSGSHIQLRITLESRAFDDFVRLDSLWIEKAPLLANEVIGEVARLDEPQPVRGFAEVELGKMTDFAYEVRASFAGGGQNGFDALRIRTGSQTWFKSLEIGEQAVDPQDVIEEGDGLLIYLSERITRISNRPMRVVFETGIFDLAATFQGEVLDRGQETLPQPVVGGDASEVLSTNSLRVLGLAEKSVQPVRDLRLSTSVFTPNGDGVNDQIEISYSLFGLPERVPVALDIYALDGRRVAGVEMGEQESGPQTIRWDGRDERQGMLAPGVYLVAVTIQSELAEVIQMRPVGLAY